MLISAQSQQITHRVHASRHAPAPEAAALPAAISLENGVLTVVAGNSDLGQIVREVARLGGFTVSGMDSGPRIFGVYGPGEPRAVLASLLRASGYNFMIVGGQAMPREMVLWPETEAPIQPANVAEPMADDPLADYYAEEKEPGPRSF